LFGWPLMKDDRQTSFSEVELARFLSDMLLQLVARH
jgi:hypothetical protein